MSDARTFERFPVLSALLAELTSVAMAQPTERLAVWDSFDDFAAQCRWYRCGLRKPEQGLATAHVGRLFAARGGKTWNLIQRLNNRFQREWFGLEYLLWRSREEICRPALLEMTKCLDVVSPSPPPPRSSSSSLSRSPPDLELEPGPLPRPDLELELELELLLLQLQGPWGTPARRALSIEGHRPARFDKLVKPTGRFKLETCFFFRQLRWEVAMDGASPAGDGRALPAAVSAESFSPSSQSGGCSPSVVFVPKQRPHSPHSYWPTRAGLKHGP